jgi:hypothetical protein
VLWLFVAACALVPFAALAGYLLAVHRVAKTVAAMGPDELKALEARVATERARHLSISEIGVLEAWRKGDLVAKAAEPDEPVPQ